MCLRCCCFEPRLRSPAGRSPPGRQSAAHDLGPETGPCVALFSHNHPDHPGWTVSGSAAEDDAEVWPSAGPLTFAVAPAAFVLTFLRRGTTLWEIRSPQQAHMPSCFGSQTHRPPQGPAHEAHGRRQSSAGFVSFGNPARGAHPVNSIGEFRIIVFASFVALEAFGVHECSTCALRPSRSFQGLALLRNVPEPVLTTGVDAGLMDSCSSIITVGRSFGLCPSSLTCTAGTSGLGS
jgi:hypothetical protein